VDIDKANKAKSDLAAFIDGKDARILNRVGAFASLFQFDVSKYREPVLVLKTEEPGSKQILAFAHDKIESVCYDMINHLINDCIVMGAEPMSVQDLIVCGKIDPAIVKRIVSACSQACIDQDCVLTGGETTEQPDVIPDGTYVLGSSVVGVVEKSAIIDGSDIRAGDKVIGIRSSGLHTNGYTFVRDLLSRNKDLALLPLEGSTFIERALVPHRGYYKSLRGLFDRKVNHGMAHITGGGIRENLNRILPKNTDAQIDLDTYPISDLFCTIKKESNAADEVMLRTFNMGIGLTLVCPPEAAAQILDHLETHGEKASIIGSIVPGNGVVQCTGKLNYK